jgi:hypothetical protein
MQIQIINRDYNPPVLLVIGQYSSVLSYFSRQQQFLPALSDLHKKDRLVNWSTLRSVP